VENVSRQDDLGLPGPWLSVREAASYLNVSERFVRRLVYERRIAFHHFGKLVRLNITDLNKFANAGRVEPMT
jgi:excisionase family DNA binding protein